MEKIREALKYKENLVKSLMHNNDCDEQLKCANIGLPKKKFEPVSTEKPKTFKFYSDSWRVFLEGEVIPRKPTRYLNISITNVHV